jgi:hypothetical protein
MVTRLKRVDPLSFAVVSGVLYGLLSIVFVIIVGILVAMRAPFQSGPPLTILVFLPVIYAVLGFIFGAITAFLYNLVAGWTGGVEITFGPWPSA